MHLCGCGQANQLADVVKKWIKCASTSKPTLDSHKFKNGSVGHGPSDRCSMRFLLHRWNNQSMDLISTAWQQQQITIID